MIDYYDFLTAYNPDTEELVRDALFQVFATSDSALANPLQVFAADSGAALTLRSNSIGMLPSFRVQGNPTQVILRSGSFLTLVSSKYGFVKEGLDPETVKAAIASVGIYTDNGDGTITLGG